jgi:hypothetical protein
MRKAARLAMRTGQADLEEIESWEEVPAFSSEADEADFWSTYGSGERAPSGYLAGAAKSASASMMT